MYNNKNNFMEFKLNLIDTNFIMNIKLYIFLR